MTSISLTVGVMVTLRRVFPWYLTRLHESRETQVGNNLPTYFTPPRPRVLYMIIVENVW